jgi:hypothetical protein
VTYKYKTPIKGDPRRYSVALASIHSWSTPTQTPSACLTTREVWSRLVEKDPKVTVRRNLESQGSFHACAKAEVECFDAPGMSASEKRCLVEIE